MAFHTVAGMRRYLSLLALLIATSLTAGETPAEIAARQEAEDNYRRINARVDDLFAAIESMQKRFSALQDELRKLGEEVNRATDKTRDTSAQENLKTLAKAIEDVDKKRIADRDKFLSALADLEKSISNFGKSTSPPPKPTKPRVQSPKNDSDGSTPPPRPEKGYEYTIQEGDTLTRIVAALNKQGLKITAKQISDVNAGVNWNRLHIGQKIFIPAP